MKRSDLVTLVRETFPPIGRPSEITVHGEACRECSWTLEELAGERGSRLSQDGVRWLLGELSTLSPEGFRWVLPSYLGAILEDENNDDLGEFLAYHCARVGGDREVLELHRQLDVLSVPQIRCLIEVLRYVREELGEIFFSDVDAAISNLRGQAERRAGEADESGGA